jgi:colanic acid/amylovoran biosynthesis glycosyltransferase
VAPLRVGYLLGIFPRLSQSFVLEEIRALQRIGCHVTVFSLTRPTATDLALVPAAGEIHRICLDRPGVLASARALLDAARQHPRRLLTTIGVLLRRRDPDLCRLFPAALLANRASARLHLDHLHAHLRTGSDCLWLAGRLSGRRWSFSTHARDIHVWNRHLTPKLADAARVVTVCEYNKALLADRLGGDGTGKIDVIRPFLAPELLAAPLPSAAGGEVFRLVCVCRLVPKKGVDVLIEALALLQERGVPAALTIVGDGPQLRSLTALAERLGLDAVVTFAGPADAAGVRASLAAAHCAVLAARRAADGDSDATPTVLGEAMAMGLPVISTRLSGIPEIVPPAAGMLVVPEDSSALADAIAAMAAEPPERRREMGQAGRAFVLAHWNGARDAHRLARVFQAATGRTRQARLWAVTCYFNPAGWQRRLHTYRLFREALQIPLVAVELGRAGRLDLTREDADILLQVPDGDVLWQKERLLNLALGALPADCEAVAWLDCDVLFERADWPRLTLEALQTQPIVQLFRQVHYLGPDWQPGLPLDGAIERSRPSIAAGVAGGLPVAPVSRIPLARAAPRHLCQRHGLGRPARVAGPPWPVRRQHHRRRRPRHQLRRLRLLRPRLRLAPAQRPPA